MNTDLIRIQPGAGVPMLTNANEANDMFSNDNGGSRLPKLSIRGGTFRYKKGGIEQNLNLRTLQVALVGARKPTQRAYFGQPYNVENPQVVPDCASDNGVAPNPGVQHPQSGTCAACPQNVWGSKISESGKGIRACGESKYLVVSPATDNINEAAVLQIPATSVKGFNQYIAALNNAGLPANAVITQIEFGDTAYPSINFSCVGYLSEAQRLQVAELAATDDVQESVNVAAPQPLPTLPNLPTVAPVEVAPAPQPAPVEAPATAFGSPSPSQTPVVQPPPAQPVAAPVAQPAPVEAPATAFGSAPVAQPAPAPVAAATGPIVPEVMPPAQPVAPPPADAGSEDALQGILANWTKS